MTSVSYGLVCDTGLCLRHTRRIIPELPQLFWHGVELSLKLSRARNGPVFDEISGIRVLSQKCEFGRIFLYTGFAFLQEHADTRCLVEYWAALGTR